MPKTPSDERKSKRRILVTAEELFAARGYGETSIRDIAAKARVNSAMIHYYFGSKERLYRTVLETAILAVRKLLADAVEGAGSVGERLARFTEAYAAYIFDHPNFVRIIHRELLAGGKRLKPVAAQNISQNHAMLREILEAGVRSGELRALDPVLTPLSLVGMIVFFKLAEPVIASALGEGLFTKGFTKRLAAHTTDLFLRGARNTDAGRPPRKPGEQARSRRRAPLRNNSPPRRK